MCVSSTTWLFLMALLRTRPSLCLLVFCLDYVLALFVLLAVFLTLSCLLTLILDCMSTKSSGHHPCVWVDSNWCNRDNHPACFSGNVWLEPLSILARSLAHPLTLSLTDLFCNGFRNTVAGIYSGWASVIHDTDTFPNPKFNYTPQRKAPILAQRPLRLWIPVCSAGEKLKPDILCIAYRLSSPMHRCWTVWFLIVDFYYICE